MKILQLEAMEGLSGGLDTRGKFVTGMMCGAAFALLFTVAFAPLAVAPGAGCALGIYAETL